MRRSLQHEERARWRRLPHMVRLFSATGEFDVPPISGAAPLCLTMLVFCALGAVVSAAFLSISRAKLCWTWMSVSVSAWLKAFVGFLFLYAIQIVDKQNGDLGYAHFVLVGLAGISLLVFELEAAAERETQRAHS